MAITFLNATGDLVVAEGHPRGYTDYKNRAGKYIQNQIEVEHDSDGRHLARLAAMVGESGTFTGNGSTQTITLADTGLTPVYVTVYEMPSPDEMVTNGGFTTDMSSWSTYPGAGSSASVAGGQSGNCCQLTTTSNVATYIYQQIPEFRKGVTYKIAAYAKAGTAGTSQKLTIQVASLYSSQGLTFPADWTLYEGIFIPSISYYNVNVEIFSGLTNDSTAGTSLIDTVSVIEYATGASYRTTAYFYSRSDTATTPSSITGTTKGSFTVSGPSNINNSAQTNYYAVLGYTTDTTFTNDAGGTDPDWVEDGEQGLGGTGTAIANKVENHIETQFLVAHNDAGAHTTDPYATASKIETGTATATGSSQAVTLTYISTVKYVEVWKASDVVIFASSSMSAGDAKKEGTAAMQTSLINSLDSGGFHFTGTAAATYYYLAIGV